MSTRTLALYTFVIGLIAGAVIAGVSPAWGQAVDINIITAVDGSDSISGNEADLQLAGLARGVTDERFLERVAGTEAGAVGFMVFSWSSGADFNTVVPWTIIRNAADAQHVAALLLAGREETGSSNFRPFPAGMTDTAGAISHALEASLASPFTARRTVLNVLSDSVSNHGPHPSAARDLAASQGITINAVVFTAHDIDRLTAYFRANVITGIGAFVEEAERPQDLPALLERKFLQDMIAGLR